MEKLLKTSALDSQEFFDFTGTIQSIQDIRMHAQKLSQLAIAYKAKIVMHDEKESGQRQYLNFGHTIGHAIELLAHGNLRHGEAVAIGMIAMTERMARDGVSSDDLTNALKARLEAVGLPTSSNLIGTSEFFDHLINDKKNRGGILNLVALKKIGSPVIVQKKLADMPDFIK